MHIYSQLRLTVCGLLFSFMVILMGCANEPLKYANTSQAINHFMTVYKSPTTGCCGA